MATYWYSLILMADKVPTYEKRVGVDAADDAAALSWITANDANYGISTTYVYLRKVYSSEALDRGFATHDGLGASTDSAATAGSTGSISAKLRLLTSQIDTMKADLTALKETELPLTSFVQVVITASASTPTQLKVGGSILSGRRGIWISNLDSSSCFIGASGVTTSGSTRGREIGANEIQFEPFGNVAIYATSATGLNVHIMEVA